MPVITFESLEAIPDGLKEHAKQVDGKFSVDVVPGAKLNEFRDNNVTISKQRDTLAKTLADLKPVVGESVEEFLAKYTELTTIAKQVQDGSLKTTDAIEKEVLTRVEAMKADHQRQLAEANAQRAAAETAKQQSDNKFNRSIIERAVTEAVVNEKSGANPGALADILSRASSVFTVSTAGQLVAKDGEAIIYGADGATPMTPLEWLAKLRPQASYLFKGSNGGGATGNNGQNNDRGGYSKEAIAAMTPAQKLALAHTLKRK